MDATTSEAPTAAIRFDALADSRRADVQQIVFSVTTDFREEEEK